MGNHRVKAWADRRGLFGTGGRLHYPQLRFLLGRIIYQFQVCDVE